MTFKIGQMSWNKGKHLSKEHIENLRIAAFAREPISENTRQKLREVNKNNKRFLGHKHSDETRELQRIAQLGEKSARWKGGITPEILRIRQSVKMKLWRLAVFERDKFTCQECGKSGIYLEAHHIKSFAKFPEFRFDVSNGKTLCRKCHDKTKRKSI